MAITQFPRSPFHQPPPLSSRRARRPWLPAVFPRRLKLAALRCNLFAVEVLVETQAAILTVPVVRYEARAPSIAPVGTLDRFQDAGGIAGAVLRQVQDATRGIVPLSRTCYRARVRGFARLHLIPVCFGIVRRQQDAEAAAPRFAFEGLKERDHRAAVVCLAAHRLRAGVDHHQPGAASRIAAHTRGHASDWPHCRLVESK